MADGPAADVGFGDGPHFNRALHPGQDAEAFEGILQSQSIHHRGDHAHVIGSGLLHPAFDAVAPAPQVAAADDNSHFDAVIFYSFDAFGQEGGLVGVDAHAARFREGLPAKFEENTFVFWNSHFSLQSSRR